MVNHTYDRNSTGSAVTAHRYVSLAEAADILGCHPRTIRRAISSGQITGHRLGTRVLRVSLDEIEKMLRAVPTVDGAA